VAKGTEYERAVRYIKESRQTHVQALRWLDRNQHGKDNVWPAVELATGGTRAFHRASIREYDLVLKVLRRLRP
jgi:hypothetical protein